MTDSTGGGAKPIRIWVLPVGNGDAIVLRFPDGTWGIVDSCYTPGTDAAAALPLLHHEMVPAKERIGFACLTHYHDDHFSGLSQVIHEHTAFCAAKGHFYHNGFEWCQRYEDIGWNGIVELAAIRATMEDVTDPPFGDWGLTKAAARHSDVICPGITAHFIAPTSDRERSFKKMLLRASHKNRRAPHAFNQIGIAFILEYGKAVLLFADDIEEPMWRRVKKLWRWPRPCWVKVSHHGGRSGNPSDLWPWLAEGSKKNRKIHAVISADGRDHPDPGVLAEIEKHAHVHMTWASRSTGLTKRTPITTACTSRATAPRRPARRSAIGTWRAAAYPDGHVCAFEVYPSGRVVPHANR